MPEIYAHMANFTKAWLKYQNSYEDLITLTFTWISILQSILVTICKSGMSSFGLVLVKWSHIIEVD